MDATCDAIASHSHVPLFLFLLLFQKSFCEKFHVCFVREKRDGPNDTLLYCSSLSFSLLRHYKHSPLPLQSVAYCIGYYTTTVTSVNIKNGGTTPLIWIGKLKGRKKETRKNKNNNIKQNLKKNVLFYF